MYSISPRNSSNGPKAPTPRRAYMVLATGVLHTQYKPQFKKEKEKKTTTLAAIRNKQAGEKNYTPNTQPLPLYVYLSKNVCIQYFFGININSIWKFFAFLFVDFIPSRMEKKVEMYTFRNTLRKASVAVSLHSRPLK